MLKPIKHKISALAKDDSFLNDRTLKRDNQLLLLFIFLSAFINPIIPSERIQVWVFDVLMTGVIIFGVTSLRFKKQKFIKLAYFGLITTILLWLNQFLGKDYFTLITFLVLIAFIVYITYSMIVHVSISQKVTKIMLLNAINSYLLLGIISAYLFALLNVIYESFFTHSNQSIFENVTNPNFHDLIYFSYVTLTTLGYGDLTPAIPLAKSLAMIVSITGQLYLTILVAMLVGKYLSQPKIEKDSL